ncbi:hypothetical protein ACPTIN_12200 [Enterococcus faecalis]
MMIKEIEKKTEANYLEEIDRHTKLTEKQKLKIKQMTTDIADMIEKDTTVPQGNDGIFFFKKSATKRLLAYRYGARKGNLTFFENRSLNRCLLSLYDVKEETFLNLNLTIRSFRSLYGAKKILYSIVGSYGVSWIVRG